MSLVHLSDGSERRWFVLRVRSRIEKSVAVALVSKGYEVLLPTYDVYKRGPRRYQQRPLFPGYLFCRIHPDAGGPILPTPGVISFIKFGGRPVPVSESEMANLERMLADAPTREPLAGVPAGTPVRILNGPLKGLDGILSSTSSERKVAVTVSLLGRSVAARLGPEILVEAIDSRIEFRNLGRFDPAVTKR